MRIRLFSGGEEGDVLIHKAQFFLGDALDALVCAQFINVLGQHSIFLFQLIGLIAQGSGLVLKTCDHSVQGDQRRGTKHHRDQHDALEQRRAAAIYQPDAAEGVPCLGACLRFSAANADGYSTLL